MNTPTYAELEKSLLERLDFHEYDMNSDPLKLTMVLSNVVDILRSDEERLREKRKAALKARMIEAFRKLEAGELSEIEDYYAITSERNTDDDKP